MYKFLNLRISIRLLRFKKAEFLLKKKYTVFCLRYSGCIFFFLKTLLEQFFLSILQHPCVA